MYTYPIVESILAAEEAEAGFKDQFKKFISGLGFLAALSGSPEAKAGIHEVNNMIRAVDKEIEKLGYPIKYHISTRPYGEPHAKEGDLGWSNFNLDLGPYSIKGKAVKFGGGMGQNLEIEIFKDRNASSEDLDKWHPTVKEIYKTLAETLPELLAAKPKNNK